MNLILSTRLIDLDLLIDMLVNLSSIKITWSESKLKSKCKGNDI